MEYMPEHLLDDAFSVASTVVIGRSMSDVDAVAAFLKILNIRRAQHLQRQNCGHEVLDPVNNHASNARAMRTIRSANTQRCTRGHRL
jgi:hypothetical protein